VSQETMQAPVCKGGRDLLDLESRNQAIDVMWLKKYLNIGPDCAIWGYVVDAIFAVRTPDNQKGVDKTVRVNPFLQSWKPSSTK
ncbi:hypothetical protein C8R43DRAFT_837007, partial [Mycena crocata]